MRFGGTDLTGRPDGARRPNGSARSARRLRGGTTTVAALAVAAGAFLAGAGTAEAAPATTPAVPKVDQQMLDSFGAFVPALIGSVSTPGPDGKVNAQLINEATSIVRQNDLPPQVRATWDKVVGFLNGTSPQVAKRPAAGPEIPTGPNKPVIQQFLYPTIGVGCLPNGNSVGTALVTAGPQQAPAPGPKAGQLGYVYTSLGTGPALNNQRRQLLANWINIDNGRTGQLQLRRNDRINAATGPGTFTGIATTGKGRVISVIYGDVTTDNKGKPLSCTIVPTVGLANA
nr:hypothetical protein [Williamsia sterculiae]